MTEEWIWRGAAVLAVAGLSYAARKLDVLRFIVVMALALLLHFIGVRHGSVVMFQSIGQIIDQALKERRDQDDSGDDKPTRPATTGPRIVL